jgi:uncharacterized protein
LAIYFFDTSALVKRYVKEDGTSWVQSVVDPQAGNDIYIAEITFVEVISGAKKRERTTGIYKISGTDAADFISQFRDDYDKQYLVLSVKSEHITQAADLVEKHKLRAYDAIQLAVAIELFEDYQTQGIQITFVSADNELLRAANAESLQIENPTNYP